MRRIGEVLVAARIPQHPSHVPSSHDLAARLVRRPSSGLARTLAVACLRVPARRALVKAADHHVVFGYAACCADDGGGISGRHGAEGQRDGGREICAVAER